MAGLSTTLYSYILLFTNQYVPDKILQNSSVSLLTAHRLQLNNLYIHNMLDNKYVTKIVIVSICNESSNLPKGYADLVNLYH